MIMPDGILILVLVSTGLMLAAAGIALVFVKLEKPTLAGVAIGGAAFFALVWLTGIVYACVMSLLT